ncbi:Fc.00g107030.m01.CDS01 [Cosmosporella sp. VM-42]
MDVVSASIGVFTAALAAYRAIANAVEVGSVSLIWDVLMRVERTRFEVWGRTLGLLDESTGEPRDKGPDNVQAVADLDRILQVDSVRLLVQDIFKSITKVLKDFEKSAKKYRLKPKVESKDEDEISQEGDSKKSGRKSRRWNKMFDSTKDFTMHLVMAVNDEDMIKDLLKSLADLNDGLEKVLSLSQKTQAANALSSVLAAYQTTDELDVLLEFSKDLSTSSQAGNEKYFITGLSQHSALLATARVKHRCVEMRAASLTKEVAPDPRFVSKPGQRAYTEVQNFEVSATRLQIKGAPRRETTELLWPNYIVPFTPENGETFQVLVEWRQPNAISPGFHIPLSEWNLRRNLLVQLLHEISKITAAADYRVLDCFAWCEYEGRVEGERLPLIGFVSKIPDSADGTRPPDPLHKLLEDSFQSDDPKTTPSLRVRFQLAKELGKALYQLQCSQWLHRNLSSHQIGFFFDKATGNRRFDAPFLIGLQYSRPNDQSPIDKEAYFKSEGFNKQSMNWGSLGLYLHPDFSNTKQRRYRRSDDIYSLGIILMEIAFWEPVQVFRQGNEREWSTSNNILEAAKTELAAEVGEFYQDAVVRCLQGLRENVKKQWLEPSPEELKEEGRYDGQYKGEDPEHGLENVFFGKY